MQATDQPNVVPFAMLGRAEWQSDFAGYPSGRVRMTHVVEVTWRSLNVVAMPSTTTMITPLVMLALAAGCEKKKADPPPKTAEQIDPAKNPWNADKLAAPDASTAAADTRNSGGSGGSAGSSSAGSNSVGSNGAGVATGSASQTAPAGGDNSVRQPVAADLAEYTKSLPGKGTKLFAKIETSKGVINCELFADKAPMTVANFVGLATGKKAWKNPKTGSVEIGKPFFDDLTFHRVIPEFMIQGGDPLGVGSGGPGYQFGDEFLPDVKMEPGTLAMANSGPATNGSQFFITEIAPEWLNGKHTVFGKCKELELVKQIARVPQDAQNKPDTPITMKITIRKG